MSRTIDRWCDFSLRTQRDQDACRSWFSLLVKPEDEVLLAQGYEQDDGSMPRIRLLVRRANTGRLDQVLRSQSRAGWKLKCSAPSADFLKRANLRGVLSQPSNGREG